MTESDLGDPRFAIGQSVIRNFTISLENMRAFESLSGDRNPLHWDEAFARQRGMERPVVYGGLLLAKISELLGMWLPGPGCVWVGINLSFAKPLFVDQPCLLQGEVISAPSSFGLMKIKHVIKRDAEYIARGTSEVYIGT